MPLPPVVVAQTAQTGILLLGGSWAGLRLGKPIGLDSPFARALVYRRALPALLRRTLISAALAGCATPSNAPPHVPFTQRRFTTPRSDQTPVPGSAALLWGAGTEFAGAGPGAAHAAGCNPKSALYKPVCTSNNLGAMQHARLAAFWTVAGVLGTLAVFPYALAINPTLVAQLPMPLPALVAAQTAQTGILLLLLSWVGLRLGQPIGLDSPFARALVYRRALPALSRRTLISAALAGCATPTHAPPHVSLTPRRFTTPRSDQTPVPGAALHPDPRGASTATC